MNDARSGEGRREQRRAVLEVLFEADQRGEGVERVLRRYYSGGHIPRWVREVALGVGEHQAALDVEIEARAHDWAVDRMPAVDRVLLRLGLYELHYRPDIPVAATINEAVELAKEFSTEDSGRFVNGVLGAAARSLER